MQEVSKRVMSDGLGANVRSFCFSEVIALVCKESELLGAYYSLYR